MQLPQVLVKQLCDHFLSDEETVMLARISRRTLSDLANYEIKQKIHPKTPNWRQRVGRPASLIVAQGHIIQRNPDVFNNGALHKIEGTFARVRFHATAATISITDITSTVSLCVLLHPIKGEPLGSFDAEPMQFVIPTCVATMVVSFDCDITPSIDLHFLDGIQALSMCPASRQKHRAVTLGTLPTSLTFLDLARATPPVTHLVHLRTLLVGHICTHFRYTLPPSLTKLRLGKSFRQPLCDVALPRQLTTLEFQEGFNGPFGAVHLPDGIDSVMMPKSFCQPINQVHWSSSLTRLSLTSDIPGDTSTTLRDATLPATLTWLHASHSRMGEVRNVRLPDSLTHLHVNGIETDDSTWNEWKPPT
jgi:hypothetical protein